ncbi:hypothetical protein CDAR_235941 [Caerostris darwini]|uniref:Uncharacterized protein n=1 Tax=Caerostris darwini TaxID=1538125 RepID=A0AAV4UFZ1_9ARAC|nr:hypothetical protein CDAR_235941 [Caerostris darwini]
MSMGNVLPIEMSTIEYAGCAIGYLGCGSIALGIKDVTCWCWYWYANHAKCKGKLRKKQLVASSSNPEYILAPNTAFVRHASCAISVTPNMKRTDGAFEWMARVKCSSAPSFFVPPPLLLFLFFSFEATREFCGLLTLFFAVKVPVTACDGECRYFHGGCVRR